MILIIGGAFQGKKEYAMQKYDIPEKAVFDAVLPDLPKADFRYFVIRNLQDYIKNRIREGGNPEKEIFDFTSQNDCIVICNEIGNGIVPMDSFEREWRERTGRILIQLAAESDEVIRVVCGIGQKIK